MTLIYSIQISWILRLHKVFDLKIANSLSSTKIGRNKNTYRIDIIKSLKFFLFRMFLWVSAYLPLSFVQLIAKFWGVMLYWLPTRAQKRTRKNLSFCFPAKSKKQINQLTHASLNHTAATALEMGKSWILPISETLKMVVDSEGESAFHDAVNSDDGVILLAPHLGNWEIFGLYLCDDAVSTWLYQPPKLKQLDQFITRTRSRSGISMSPTNRLGVSKVLKALKRGELVGVLPDQVPPREGGQFAPFYDQPALTMTLISKLVQKTGAKVFCGFAKRLPEAKGYKVIVEEAAFGIYKDNLDESLAALNSTIESSINKAVEQYQWEYTRFRKTLDGTKFY